MAGNYGNLNSQLNALQSKITTAVTSSPTSQDLIYIAAGLANAGTAFGSNDITNAASDALASGLTSITAAASAAISSSNIQGINLVNNWLLK